MGTEQLAELISSSRNIVFFGGAGVSTESGIPDFRGEDGIYKAKRQYGYPPEVMLSHTFFVRHPAEFYKYYKENLIYTEAKPNAAHRALAELEQAGKLKAVITQNIDGLHQMAGSRNVLELHGSIYRNRCLQCGQSYGLEAVLNSEEGVPVCRKCGGMVKPDVVLYEESLNNEILEKAVNYIGGADVLIVGGTSLAVYPAAGLINYYHGQKLVLINKSTTPYDRHANLVIHDAIGKVLGEALNSCI